MDMNTDRDIDIENVPLEELEEEYKRIKNNVNSFSEKVESTEDEEERNKLNLELNILYCKGILIGNELQKRYTALQEKLKGEIARKIEELEKENKEPKAQEDYLSFKKSLRF